MNAERLEKIDELFQAALEMTSDRRAAFLEDACAGDAELRGEVESLLSAHDHAGDFIEESAADIAAEFITGERQPPGDFISGYRVLSLLGAGGMGEVYLAEDARLGRKVALKLLPASFAENEDRVQRFRREARTTSALNHPNILTVYETGRWRGRDFIATEFVDGVTLRTQIDRGGLSLAASLDIGRQILSALAAAHDAGIVHRDINSQNVMVRPDGLVKVLDFGIAKYTDPGFTGDCTDMSGKTASGVVVGTIAYMSPEQARGLPVDARTDIWSLGVIVYEMIAGKLPFLGQTSSDRIAAILEREPEPLTRVRHGLPIELDRVVGRALAKDRDERYPRAAEFAEDLREIRATLGEAVAFRFALPGLSPVLHSRRRPMMVVAGLLLVLTAVVAASLAYYRSSGATAPIDSLAVLPLEKIGGDNDTEFVADGITESLINSLSQLPDLKVMSRNSVFRYKGQDPDATAIGNSLRVDAVLTGRLVQRAEELSISVELVDARDGSHIWGEQYDNRRFTAVMSLQNEIARDVSRKLRTRLAGEDVLRLTKNDSAHPEAYRQYLRGRYHVLKLTQSEIQTGISYFRQAIDLDPAYARAHAGLADAYRVLALAGESPATEELPKAKAAAQRALDIDENMAAGHAVLGSVMFWYDWNWNEAEKHFKRALQLDPNSVEALEAYAHLLSNTGRHAEGLAVIRHASELDPLNLRTSALEGQFLVNAGHSDEALVTLNKTLELEPNYWFAQQYVASAYIEKGMLGEAVDVARRAGELSGVSTRPASFLGYALAKAGRTREARIELDKVLKLSKERYVSPYNIALIYHGLGDREATLAWLERGYQQREPRMAFLRGEPKWNSLRDDPRFQALLQRVGSIP